MTISTRLLPIDPRTRDVALGLFAIMAEHPIISPHGHVPAQMLLEDQPFSDPVELLVTKDHYLTRLLHADGVDLSALGVGGAEVNPRAAWRTVCSRWHLFAGTATGHWLGETLRDVFGIGEELDENTADDAYDAISTQLQTDRLLPRALLRAFDIDVLATTDDPLDALDAHRALQRDGLRVIPTFRPDRYTDPLHDDFASSVVQLIEHEEQSATFSGYLAALERRRRYFIDAGAVSADHGVVDPTTLDLSHGEAAALFARCLNGALTADDARRFRAHMLLQMAGMSVEDGLVMTVHPGVHRNHSSSALRAYGPDTGHDIPTPTSFVWGMRPLLERYGLDSRLHLILYTVDETAYSREIAPLAGFYPSVYIGAPWWFLDAPDAMDRFRAAVTETAGFSRGSGFVDDTRALLSIPARHETARRVDAGYLARLVVQGRVTQSRAEAVAADLVDAIPRRAFKL